MKHLHLSGAEGTDFLVCDVGSGDVAFEIDDSEHSLSATLVLSEVYDVARFLQDVIERYNVVSLINPIDLQGGPNVDVDAQVSSRLFDDPVIARAYDRGYANGESSFEADWQTAFEDGPLPFLRDAPTTPRAFVEWLQEQMKITVTPVPEAHITFLPGTTVDEFTDHLAKAAAVMRERLGISDPVRSLLGEDGAEVLGLDEPAEEIVGSGYFRLAGPVEPFPEIEIPTVLSERIEEKPPLTVEPDPRGIRIRFYGSQTVLTIEEAGRLWLALGKMAGLMNESES